MQNNAFLAEDKEGAAFEQAARYVIGNDPMGVGPNHHVVVANAEGPSERVGDCIETASRSSQVRNTLVFVAASLGEPHSAPS